MLTEGFVRNVPLPNIATAIANAAKPFITLAFYNYLGFLISQPLVARDTD